MDLIELSYCEDMCKLRLYIETSTVQHSESKSIKVKYEGNLERNWFDDTFKA